MTAFQRRASLDFKTQYGLGFSSQDDYQIDRGADGKAFTKSQQVHMCGNSVSPPHMAAIARANDPWRVAQELTRNIVAA